MPAWFVRPIGSPSAKTWASETGAPVSSTTFTYHAGAAGAVTRKSSMCQSPVSDLPRDVQVKQAIAGEVDRPLATDGSVGHCDRNRRARPVSRGCETGATCRLARSSLRGGFRVRRVAPYTRLPQISVEAPIATSCVRHSSSRLSAGVQGVRATLRLEYFSPIVPVPRSENSIFSPDVISRGCLSRTPL